MRFLSVLISLLLSYFLLQQYGGFSFLGGTSVKVSADGFVAIDSGNKYFEYDINDTIEYSGYRVLQFDKANRSLQAFGIQYQLALLTNDAYQEFEEIEASGSCAASFLNQNAEMLLLVVPDDEKANFKPGDIAPGDSVQLTGSELVFAYGEIGGHQVEHFGTGQVAPVLIDEMTVF